MDKVYLLLEKRTDSQYDPTETSASLDELINSLEYGDVAEGKYQIWEYPSGVMYRLETDRVVDERHYYSGTVSKEGIVWLPRLKRLNTDKYAVEQCYQHYESQVRKKVHFMDRLRKILKSKP